MAIKVFWFTALLFSALSFRGDIAQCLDFFHSCGVQSANRPRGFANYFAQDLFALESNGGNTRASAQHASSGGNEVMSAKLFTESRGLVALGQSGARGESTLIIAQKFEFGGEAQIPIDMASDTPTPNHHIDAKGAMSVKTAQEKLNENVLGKLEPPPSSEKVTNTPTVEKHTPSAQKQNSAELPASEESRDALRAELRQILAAVLADGQWHHAGEMILAANRIMFEKFSRYSQQGKGTPLDQHMRECQHAAVLDALAEMGCRREIKGNIEHYRLQSQDDPVEKLKVDLAPNPPASSEPTSEVTRAENDQPEAPKTVTSTRPTPNSDQSAPNIDDVVKALVEDAIDAITEERVQVTSTEALQRAFDLATKFGLAKRISRFGRELERREAEKANQICAAPTDVTQVQTVVAGNAPDDDATHAVPSVSPPTTNHLTGESTMVFAAAPKDAVADLIVTQTSELDISQISLDERLQSRAAMNTDAITEYGDNYRNQVEMPPVVVFRIGLMFILVDGFHRVAGALEAGLTRIAVVILEGTIRDALLYATRANATHGLRRTNADKRRAVEILLRDGEWKIWADRAIARHCGVSHNFVGSVRSSLSSDDSEKRKYRTKHGSTASMRIDRKATKKSKSGKSKEAPCPADAEIGNSEATPLDAEESQTAVAGNTDPSTTEKSDDDYLAALERAIQDIDRRCAVAGEAAKALRTRARDIVARALARLAQ